MPTVAAFTPKYQLIDSNGDLGVGWKLYTYAAGTDTPLASYTDSSGETANANPVIADARGEMDVWLDVSLFYKIVLKDDDDNLIWTVDDFGPNFVTSGDVTIGGDLIGAPQWLQFAIMNQDSTLTTGLKFTSRLPACTVQYVRASLKTASTSGAPVFDIKKNGTTILSTKITIDQDEKTSTTATTPPVISVPTFADDDEITFHIDTAGTNAVGPLITMKVKWTN